ncbi:NAD(P)H-dependent flavin oxidoreductase [Silvanigrella aquatica]|uniref:Nitronate monooxygenase n=1 Tax=Silvanigrella aquatica TaxID=1915309 RepID=A0A1L4D296_9BACT|nr:nitronate monooxygenase [Silvanigrella aquatica]APJ04316.1 hypothetical protein AXG55_10525 [Silvanigrella aquatica]
MKKNKLLEQLDIQIPLIVAPMAGGLSTPELVACAAQAGAIGFLACSYDSPENMDAQIKKVKQLTHKHFAVNLFTQHPALNLTEQQIEKAIVATNQYREELKIPSLTKLNPPYAPDFEKQFEIVLANIPKAFSFTFGLIKKEHIKECNKKRIVTIGTATQLKEALSLQELGVDALVAQGVEAGGHRGFFDPNENDPNISTDNLVSQFIKKLNIPVIAAGGIMNQKHIQKILSKGASAVQMGTAFLLSSEAGTSEPYRRALREKKRETELTKVFSGRYARGLKNRFMTEMKDKVTDSILPFPAQNALTRDIRSKAAQMDQEEFLSLWAGSNAHMIKEHSALEIISKLNFK